MKKDFSRLSERPCVDCSQPLKQNLVDRNPEAKRCHTCNKLASNSMNFDRSSYRDKQRRNRIKYNHKP